MDFRLCGHAEWEMARRGIPLALVQSVLEHPRTTPCRRILRGPVDLPAQSRFPLEDGKMYLLRVVVDEDEKPPVIITDYRTSKIEKYWSAK